MDEEIKALMHNNTWTLVDPPAGANIVSCKWVYKTKRNLDGSVKKYKARLVARGFSQKYGTDYDEVFAPVVRHTTFRVFLTVAGMKGMHTRNNDANSAFLNGILENDIYMHQPQGYVDSKNKNKVCKLNKGIYGLKQAAKIWNDKLVATLNQYGFTQSKIGPCLFVKFDNGTPI